MPSIWFFSFFRNRVMSISVTTMTRADEFLRHFAQAARSKPAGRGAAGPGQGVRKEIIANGRSVAAELSPNRT